MLNSLLFQINRRRSCDLQKIVRFDVLVPGRIK